MNITIDGVWYALNWSGSNDSQRVELIIDPPGSGKTARIGDPVHGTLVQSQLSGHYRSPEAAAKDFLELVRKFWEQEHGEVSWREQVWAVLEDQLVALAKQYNATID